MLRRLLSRAVDLIVQLICGLHGHDELLHFEATRLSMRCTTCGHETPGWELKAPASRAAAPSRPRVLRLPVVHERRVA